MRFARRKTSPRAGGGYGPLKQGKHTQNPGWKHGQHWVECQRCGLDYYVSDIKVQWDGLVTCLSCWEPRHPQDFVRGVHDDMRPRGPGNPVGNIDPTISVAFPVTGTFNNDLSALGAQSPSDLGAQGWWDFSIAGTVGGPVGGTWQDQAGTIPCVAASTMLRVDDKSGNSFHATNSVGAQIWTSPSFGGFGTGEFVAAGGSLLTPGSIAASAPAWSVLVLARRDSSLNASTIMGATGPGAAETWHLAPFDATPALRTYHIGIGNTGGAGPRIISTTTLWTGTASNLQWWLFEFNQTDSSSYRPISGSVALDTTGSAWPDAEGPGSPIRLGAESGGGNHWRNFITEIAIFDRNLTANERTQLYNYHNARYGLSTQ